MKWRTYLNHYDEDRPRWQASRYYFDREDDRAGGRIEWSFLGDYSFGWGVRFGRNGGESDIGLDLYAGRLGSVWMRLRHPALKWLRVSKEDDPKGWYRARHTGIRLFAGDYRWIGVEWDNPEHGYGNREWHFGPTQLWGRTRHDTQVLTSGETTVPMPEGNYHATWERIESRRRYVRWPGTWKDRLSPHVRRYVRLDVPGGIPHWGKGENSWDCGMDGVMGTGGSNVSEAVANAVRSALRDRERYGPREPLPRPMTISEAEEHLTGRAV